MSENTALLIIDMQNDFVLPGAPACVAGAYETIPNLVRVLSHFRGLGLPVFHVVREYRADGSDVEITRRDGFLAGPPYVVAGTPGSAIVEQLAPLDGEYRIVKRRFSAFMATETDFMLRRLGVTRVVVCGTQYPNCIRTTVFDAVCHGYEVVLVTDACSAESVDIAQANMRDMANIGVCCVNTNEFIAAGGSRAHSR